MHREISRRHTRTGFMRIIHDRREKPVRLENKNRRIFHPAGSVDHRCPCSDCLPDQQLRTQPCPPGGKCAGTGPCIPETSRPGAGIFIASAFTCLWLVLGILITKKPGTVILITVLLIIFSLVFSLAMGGHGGYGGHASTGNSSTSGGSAVERPAGGEMSAAGASGGAPTGGQQPVRLDYLALVVAIIIECAGMLALEQKPWKYIFPSLLSIMGIITLALWLTGNAKMGENGDCCNGFPARVRGFRHSGNRNRHPPLFVSFSEVYHRRRMRRGILYRILLGIQRKERVLFLGSGGPGDTGTYNVCICMRCGHGSNRLRVLPALDQLCTAWKCQYIEP